MPKRILQIAIIVAIALVTAACATGGTQFYNAKGSPQTFDQDRAECLYQAQLHASADPIMWPSIVKSCLATKGWVAQR